MSGQSTAFFLSLKRPKTQKTMAPSRKPAMLITRTIVLATAKEKKSDQNQTAILIDTMKSTETRNAIPETMIAVFMMMIVRNKEGWF